NPGVISDHSKVAAEKAGVWPAVWGQDFGFSAEAWDGIQYRDELTAEAIRQHERGSIVTMMWHAVRPIEGEPGTFKENVCGPMERSAWDALLSPGSSVYKNWIKQVDVIAELLTRLRDARV